MFIFNVTGSFIKIRNFMGRFMENYRTVYAIETCFKQLGQVA